MVRVGKIVTTHGLQGAVIMTHVTGSSKWLKKGLALFLELQKQSYIPFFVVQGKPTNDEEFILEFEDVITVEEAKKLVGKNVFAEQQYITASVADSPLAWIGFKLVDEEKGELGVIEDVFKTSSQWLAKLVMDGKEVLIPLIEQTIIKTDMKKRIVEVELPDGLLEIYLD